jgi:hypothetical protein
MLNRRLNKMANQNPQDPRATDTQGNPFENNPAMKPYNQEFAEETHLNPEQVQQAQQNPANNFTGEAEQKSAGAPEETKDSRGGNHNPKGANQYTSGRVDDRGRKS